MKRGLYRATPPRKRLYNVILEYVAEHPGTTCVEVARVYNMTVKGARSRLSTLYHRGLVVRGKRVRSYTKYEYSYYVRGGI